MDKRDVRTLMLYSSETKNRYKYIKKFLKKDNELKNLEVYTSLDATQTLFVWPSLANETWLEEVNKKREMAAEMVAPGIRCRPMHLVSYHPEEARNFWATNREEDLSEEKEKPFLLMTVVYGVNCEDKDLSGNVYESVMKDYLETLNLEKDKLTWVVYNTMDVGDIVVLWFTSDIHYGFQQAISISQNGIARKTYTALYFPLYIQNDGEHTQIKPSIIDIIKESKDNFRIVISGAIRNHHEFELKIDDIKEKIKGGNHEEYTFGRDDFRISNTTASGEVLANTLQFFVNNEIHQLDGDSSSAAENPIFWALHGYFSPCYAPKPADKSVIPPQRNKVPVIPTPLLKQVYNSYQEIYQKMKQEKKIDKYPWASALGELLGVYANMDSDPAFHGPGYLIYDCAAVFNSYLKGEVKPYIEEKLDALLCKSEESILCYVESLSQLADRLVRMDELTLNGFGGYSPIHGMLPESMLRFCYGFMRKFVDLLIDIDKEKGRKPENFAYAFLLFPGLSEGMRISSVFKTDVQDWEDCLEESSAGQIFPSKHLYLLEFPAKDMYHPGIFFPQIFHECLHRFGDVLRCRKERKKYMAAYMGVCALDWMGLNGNSEDEKKLFKLVAEEIYKSNSSDYLCDIKEHLAAKMRELFSTNAAYLTEFANEMEGKLALYSNYMLRRWIDIAEDRDGILDEYIIECAYLFRECYADVMMIEFTKLEPNEYLELLVPELKKSETETKNCFIIERVAIVLAACQICGTSKGFEDADRVKCALREKEFPSRNKCDALYQDICIDLPNQPQETEMTSASVRERSSDNIKYYRPAAALRYVVDYCVEAIKKKRELLKRFYDLDVRSIGIKNNFSDIVRDENFFGDEYFEIFQDERKKLKKRMNELKR